MKILYLLSKTEMNFLMIRKTPWIYNQCKTNNFHKRSKIYNIKIVFKQNVNKINKRLFRRRRKAKKKRMIKQIKVFKTKEILKKDKMKF